MPVTDKPLNYIDFSSLIATCGPFEHRPQLAVAVSGGIDSMALLLLAHHWAKSVGGSVTALTVDHGLRSASKTEALQVHSWCKNFGIEHHILAWNPPGLASAIPAQARAARYKLLTEWCRNHHIIHLLTAHHSGDQAETLLLRTARGSGIDGLACMSACSQVNGIRLLRPLLSISKPQLKAMLLKSGQEWCEDPTNQNPRYTRNYIRHALEKNPQAEALESQALELANSFGIIRNLLENNLASQLTNCISLFPGGYGFIDKNAFCALSPDYALRAITALISTLNGTFDPPRKEKLQRFYEELIAGKIKRRTFAGLLFTWQEKTRSFAVCREAKALENAIMLPAETPAIWDKRFHVAWAATAPATDEISVHAAGSGGIAQFKKITLPLEKTIFSTLPSFWHLEELVAIPHIGYRNPAYPDIECTARFVPAKALAGKAFSAINSATTKKA